MFQAYEYFNEIFSSVKLGSIQRISGIASLEEHLSDIRSIPQSCLLVTDSGSGKLNLKDRRLDNGYHLIYVMERCRVNDNAGRLAAKRLAMIKAIRLFDIMKSQAKDYGDPAYGFNEADISYDEIGPIGQNYYGYSFGFLVEQAVPFEQPPYS